MFSTKFISATKDYSTFFHSVPAPYIRKSFELDNELKKAEITICGLGFYELYINGTKITKGYLAPYISNPDDILYYDNYDLTSLLRVGKNVIGIMLGNGMQNSVGGQIWCFDEARFRSSPKVALSFVATYINGENYIINADETFKTAPSPIYFDDLRCGEFYDARNEIPGWNLPDFNDSEWNNAFISETPRGETRICTAEPIVATKELKPVSIKKGYISEQPITRPNLPVIDLPDDENCQNGWIYDFGVNAAGLCRLKIKGRKGQKIALQFGEVLDENGNFDLRGMTFLPRRFNHRDIYICKGDGEETYIPSFTYHGFRYCLVTGIEDEQATESLLTYVVMNSDIETVGEFKCSDDMVNKLQSATLVSDLANFYYFPTDCPHREKNGWTADAALSAEQMLINFSVENSYFEWLKNIRKAQLENGAIPGIIPTTGWGYEWGSGPAWDCVLIYLPYFTWLYRGDLEILNENSTAILRYINYLTTKFDKFGLLHFGLGDWCHAGRDASNPKAPLEVTDTIISMDICQKASVIFDAIGLKTQKLFADSVYSELRNSVRKYLVDFDTMTVKGNCQTSQAMALFYGVFNENEKEKAFKVLENLVIENNSLLDVGVLGARIIFHALSQFGRADLAYHMITCGEFPSYAYWINNGNTSLCESFRPKGHRPESKNHHFFGDISAWFYKCIVGINVNPNADNINEILIRPNFIDKLDWADGWVNIPAGKVSVNWKREGKDIILTCKVPENCEGLIKLPCNWIFDDNKNIKAITNGIFHIVSKYN